MAYAAHKLASQAELFVMRLQQTTYSNIALYPHTWNLLNVSKEVHLVNVSGAVEWSFANRRSHGAGKEGEGWWDISDQLSHVLEFARNDGVVVIAAGNKGRNLSIKTKQFTSCYGEESQHIRYGAYYDIESDSEVEYVACESHSFMTHDELRESVIYVGSVGRDGSASLWSAYAGDDPEVQGRTLFTYGESMTLPDITMPDSYTSTAGTSFASPMVGAAIAMLKEKYPSFSHQGIAQALLDSAYRDFEGYDATLYGQGIMDLEAADALLSLRSAETNPASQASLNK